MLKLIIRNKSTENFQNHHMETNTESCNANCQTNSTLYKANHIACYNGRPTAEDYS